MLNFLEAMHNRQHYGAVALLVVDILTLSVVACMCFIPPLWEPAALHRMDGSMI